VLASRRIPLVALLAVVLTLAAAPIARAYWGYYGWVPNGYDSSCLWYPSQARCSGWNNWVFVQGSVYTGGPVLVGFENYERIRGQYAYAGDYRDVEPYMVGMCCYLIAHGTDTAVPAWVSLWTASR
jgi:hypothetical protein